MSPPSSIPPLVEEEERLNALHRYNILDTDPEPAFDRIAKLAAHLFDAPIALVNFIDHDRQWFKATVGMDKDETRLDVSICTHTIEAQAPMVVEDLTADERFADNPYVTDAGVAFYAGAPLVTPNEHYIGTLCVLDFQPRTPSTEVMDRLADLASMVVDELELRRENAQRKETEAALRRSQTLLEQAERTAQVGGWQYDVREDSLLWTAETYRIHGLSPDEDIDVTEALKFYTAEGRPVIQSHIERLIEDGGEYDLELRIRTADGHLRWVRTIGKALPNDGETTRLIGAVQDITDRIRQRDALKAAKETAEEADRIKSALLSNINHEFRTPLTSIISFSEVIRDNPELADDFADRILGGGQRLLHTLNTVMDYAKLEGDHVSGTPTLFNLGDVAASVLETFRNQADRKGLTLELNEPTGPVTAELDRHFVERILTHLVSNAVKFTENGSVTVVLRKEEGYAELQVEDTGIGIDPDVLPRLFDEFAQASSGYDRTHEGNGLGLTIVRRIVGRMGGTIDIDSAPNEGTCVTVRLPTADRDVQIAPRSKRTT